MAAPRFHHGSALGVLVRGVAVLLLRGVATAAGDIPSSCQAPPRWYTDAQLSALQAKICGENGTVKQAIRELHKAADGPLVSKEQAADWRVREVKSQEMCDTSLQQLRLRNYQAAAIAAADAWRFGMSKTHECCTLLKAPHCVPQADTKYRMRPVGVFAALGAFWVVAIFVGSYVHTCCKKRIRSESAPPSVDVASLRTVDRTPSPPKLQPTLQREWQTSCLRTLPRTDECGRASSSLFAALHATFDFQEDNVRNQYEHLISLWRSHCALVADRAVGDEEPVDEESLLLEALGDLHTELLEGFQLWRRRFMDAELIDAPSDALPSTGCIDWKSATRTGSPAADLQLVEISMYLLIWGEAGNVRFMPEVLYFLTEMALAANTTALYRLSASLADQGAQHSGLFLSSVLRPIYNVVFDELYNRYNTETRRFSLREGYERFLPADVANYDDWNEFFCDPAWIQNRLLMTGGTCFFEIPPEERFAALQSVDWKISLDAAETKTHREVHSLYGLFATMMRVLLLHEVLFAVTMVLVTPDPKNVPEGQVPFFGKSFAVRLAQVGLIVPQFALAWAIMRHEISSVASMSKISTPRCVCGTVAWSVFYALPLITNAGVRYFEVQEAEHAQHSELLLPAIIVHYAVSVLGLASLLLSPGIQSDKQFALTRVDLVMRLVRWFFWSCVIALKFLVGLFVVQAMWNLNVELDITLPGRVTFREAFYIWRSDEWTADLLRWMFLWFVTQVLYLTDTSLWFTLGWSIFGVTIVFVQRSCQVNSFCCEEWMTKIPERFMEKVLPYAKDHSGNPDERWFRAVWDRILEYMHYEDIAHGRIIGSDSFNASGERISGKSLVRPLQRADHTERTPLVLLPRKPFEHFLPNNEAMQWRLSALARGLGLDVIPRPFRAPYVPGITVLIPHYKETIIFQKDDLYGGRGDLPLGDVAFCGIVVPTEETVPLIDWLHARYPGDFLSFRARMMAKERLAWPAGVGTDQWHLYEDTHWRMICMWASMRMQTLYRTVAGVCLYHPALQCHYEVQGLTQSRLGKKDVWNASDCFTCLVSMQVYKQFDKAYVQDTNKMFAKFPDCFKVAYIDSEDKGANANTDNVLSVEPKRHFSCLIDKQSRVVNDGFREPKFRVELPGFPILGDGKGDNQNHAIPFMRGSFCQCIDANQGAYFEQMLMLPCVLGEFRTSRRGQANAKQIIGLPEHITSDFGSIGDFAAGSEVAFSTIAQRAYAVLGGRMHYGHPDIMNKQYMMQQGGVSKATKTLNLSEDIFAGMDFTLRGEGRSIKHCEYFHLAKGRDLGFNAVLGFFSKLSSGTGEQVLSRQTFRLMTLLDLPECLTYWYAHGGHYITQYLMSLGMFILLLTWILVLASGCDDSFPAFAYCEQANAARAFAKLLSAWYSYLLLAILLITSLPLFLELWMQRGLLVAGQTFLLNTFVYLSPLMFIFQAKIIGHYITNEIRYGGATYVATGRGLPTERREFVGAPSYLEFILRFTVRRFGLAAAWEDEEEQERIRDALVDAVCQHVRRHKGEISEEGIFLQHLGSDMLELCVRPSEDEVANTIPIKAALTAPDFFPTLQKKLQDRRRHSEGFTGPVKLHLDEMEMVPDWNIEKVGGLYLDYAKLAHYDGMFMLLGTILVLCMGGVQDAGDSALSLVWSFIPLLLTIVSYLFAPYVFNPYQFAASYFLEDMRAWWGFFFRDSGKNWFGWYEKNRLQTNPGVFEVALDMLFLGLYFIILVFVAALYAKLRVLQNVYSMSYMTGLLWIIVCPPVILSHIFCFLVWALELGLGFRYPWVGSTKATRASPGFAQVRTLRHSDGEDSDTAASDSSTDEEAVGPPVPPRKESVDYRVQKRSVRCKGLPLGISALVVFFLELLEVAVEIVLGKIFFKRPVCLVLLLKLFMLGVWLMIQESMLRLKCCKSGFLGVKTFILSNRMFMDILTSLLIFAFLSVGTLFNTLNDKFLPAFSCHHKLIYRDSGHMRSKPMDDSDDEHEDDTDSASDDAVERGTSRGMQQVVQQVMAGIRAQPGPSAPPREAPPLPPPLLTQMVGTPVPTQTMQG